MGKIPEIMKRLFDLFGAKNDNYSKHGVYQGENSFLESILLAKDPQFRQIINENDTQRVAHLNAHIARFRTRLSTESINIVRESCPKMTEANIRAEIADPTVYLIPENMLHSLNNISKQRSFVSRFLIRNSSSFLSDSNSSLGRKLVK